jgi:ABC-type multidrug transport system permease subunit
MNEERSIWQSDEPYEIPAVICTLGVLFSASMLGVLKQAISPAFFIAGLCVVFLFCLGLGACLVLSSPKRQT